MEQANGTTTYKRCRVGLRILFAAVLLVWASPAAAGTIIVGKGTADSCTQMALYEAVELARTSGGAVIRFRCGNSPVIIVLTKGELSIPDNTRINGGDMVTLGSQTFATGSQIRIQPGSTVVLSHLTLFGVVFNEGALTLNSITVISDNSDGIYNLGSLTVNDGTFVGNSAGINNFLELTVTNSRFSHNVQIPIFNVGTATVSGSTFSDNRTSGGGAILNGGTLSVRDSFFYYNTSGIANEGVATISTSLFYGHAINFSAVSNASGATLTIQRSQFHRNSGQIGAGIYNAGTLTVTSSTISGNTAFIDGGGIYTCCGGTLTLESSVVTGNTPNDIVP